MGVKQSKEEGSVLTTTPITSKHEDVDSMNAEELRLLQIQDMPKMARSETFDEKLYRKVTVKLNFNILLLFFNTEKLT